jgi:hypothetical protein
MDTMVPDHVGGAPDMARNRASDGGTGGPPTSPTIVQPPADTYWPTYPVFTQPLINCDGCTIIVKTDSGEEAAAVRRSDGSFCADVPLTLDKDNQITFTVLGKDGTPSDPATVTMKRTGNPPPTPVPMPTVNAAYRGAVSSNWLSFSQENSESNVVDGDESTYYGLANPYDGDPWVRVQLNSTAVLDHLHVVSPADCHLKEYDVLLSTKGAPVAPSPDSTDWKQVAHVTDGKGSDDVKIAATNASWVALFYISSADQSGGNCTNTLGRWKFRLSELYAYTVANLAPPGAHQPTCASE